MDVYLGYDLSFRLLVMPDVVTSEGYVVGAGFAMTRRR